MRAVGCGTGKGGGFDSTALVQRFRPFYRLHSEEMWYPCHPEDQLRCARLLSTADGSVVIPALGAGDGSPADQLLCTPVGLEQLERRGVCLDAATVAALRWAATGSPRYAFLQASTAYVLERADEGLLPPYGWLSDTNFQPRDGTWFHRGAPNNPLGWLGGDPARYAPVILDPPAGTLRGAWQEPTTTAWVQRHTVAGVAYVDIIYTCFLAWNGSISLVPGQGEHPNDVETVIVRLRASNLDHPMRYSFAQHGGYSWYESSNVERRGDRVVVYLARQSHECYPHPGRYARLFGFADDLCDAAGVTWDAPALYVNRPQGIDAFGVDTDELRCSIASADPNGVVLVPLHDPGPLWQYVSFSFLARRPVTVAAGDEDFRHQPFPLSTTKWWPGEGPTGSPPKAADPSGPGIPASFFAMTAPFLGADPMPSCGSPSPGPSPSGHVPGPALFAGYVPGPNQTVRGSDIGGMTGALAPNATFIDWRGPIGTYLLGALAAQLPGWLSRLHDPLTISEVPIGPVMIDTLSMVGLHTLTVAPVTVTSATAAGIHATAPQLSCTATLSFAGGKRGLSVSAAISSVVVSAKVNLMTPVAIPASDAAQWYVPYVGPTPCSYATLPFSTTTKISSATVDPLTISYGSIVVDVGDPGLDLLLDFILGLFKKVIENNVSAALASKVNDLLASVYDGTKRLE